MYISIIHLGLGFAAFMLLVLMIRSTSLSRALHNAHLALERERSDKVHLEQTMKAVQGYYDAVCNEQTERLTTISQLEKENAQLLTEKSIREAAEAEYRESVAKTEEKFKKEFENLANKIFYDYTGKFGSDTREKLSTILNPLSTEIQKFEKRLESSFNEDVRERFALKKEIQNIVESNKNICLQAEELSTALKSNVKLQGNWGEMVLEKILDDSGLRKGKDYTLQATGMRLSNYHGKESRPDVVIHLPGDKHIVVDSKVSLVNYQDYVNSEDKKEREHHLKLFLASIRKHVTTLSEKNYNNIDQIHTPDFVMMFMPMEGAYSVAVQEDANLHRFAWERKIVISPPTTLFSSLQIISSLWRIEQQQRSAQTIAEESGKLYDKFVSFLEDMEGINKSMLHTRNSYDKAMNKLHTGRGNIVGRCEKIRNLGANTTKKVASNLVSSSQVGHNSNVAEPLNETAGKEIQVETIGKKDDRHE